MFVGGSSDLPTFIASGVDPFFVGMLPYGVRHLASALPAEEQLKNSIDAAVATRRPEPTTPASTQPWSG